MLFVPEQAGDGAQVLEDGFAVMLTTPSWTAVRHALIDGQALSVRPTGDGLSFSVEWQDDVYLNPVDEKAYVAPGGWVTYHPDSSRATEPQGKVFTEHVRLLTADGDLGRRTTAEDLAAFCRAVERCAELALGESPCAFKVLVQFRCTPAGHEIEMAQQGEPVPELVQAFFNSLVPLPKLPVREEEVTFQMRIAVSP